MTNETARREIESLDYYLQNHTDDYSEESHTAMMMAIKALEQQSCDDAVSRQAILDIVDSYSESKSNVEDVTQDIISDIVALLPVNPQNCDNCEVGNPCLYCRHKFEPQVKKRGVASHTDEIKKRNTRTAEQEETELGSKE